MALCNSDVIQKKFMCVKNHTNVLYQTKCPVCDILNVIAWKRWEIQMFFAFPPKNSGWQRSIEWFLPVWTQWWRWHEIDCSRRSCWWKPWLEAHSLYPLGGESLRSSSPNVWTNLKWQKKIKLSIVHWCLHETLKKGNSEMKVNFSLRVSESCNPITMILYPWRNHIVSLGSTLIQVLAWCQMAPSHYLNQCWPIINTDPCQSSEDFTGHLPDIYQQNMFKNYKFKIAAMFPKDQWFNSLWPWDAIWRHRSGSILAQVMACCLTAPSHYLSHCWPIISKVQWHSSDGNFTRDASAINYISRMLFKCPRGQWVKPIPHSLSTNAILTLYIGSVLGMLSHTQRVLYCSWTAGTPQQITHSLIVNL